MVNGGKKRGEGGMGEGSVEGSPLAVRPSPFAERSEVAVLLPAAGSGTRMGGAKKQFRLLGGKPLLVQTLLVFEQHPAVDILVVAAPEAERATLEEALREAGLAKLHAVVAGGATRQDSVAAALGALPESVAVVLVHDAVRPFVEEKQLNAVIEVARTEGAAALALPLADTLRRGADGLFGETLSRAGLYRMQTPQGFRRDWFEAAHAEAARTGHQATDDVALVQHLGHPVRIIEGSADNFKITTPEDWRRALRLWESRSKEARG